MKLLGKRVHLARYISEDEIKLIEFQLGLEGSPDIVKSALQRLCDKLEAGFKLKNAQPIRQLIYTYVWTGSVLVRRWCYKVFALIGAIDDADLLKNRLKEEKDPENVTWIASALCAIKGQSFFEFLLKSVDSDMKSNIILSSLLYTDINSIDKFSMNIDNSSALSLKWCSLLVGYDRAPDNLLHPYIHTNAVIGVLNSHDDPEVAEYSVWSMWKNPAFGVDSLKFNISDTPNKPENVRRWIARVITKSQSYLLEERDTFDMLRRDDSPKAREGLAIGLRSSDFSFLSDRVLDWIDREKDTNIRELLLEAMASWPPSEQTYDLLVESYRDAHLGSALRRRLRAALPPSASKLQHHLQKIDLEEEHRHATLRLDGFNKPEASEAAMTNGSVFNNYGTVNAQNVGAGAVNAQGSCLVQNNGSQPQDIMEFLDRVMAVIEESRAAIGDQKYQQLTRAADEVRVDPTSSAKKAALSDHIRTAGSIASIVGAATKLPELIEMAKSWL